jgi:superfamily II DNA or RNA helicase
MMIYNININNVMGQVVEQLPPEVLTYIEKKTRYHPAGYQHTWNYKHKKWDGWNYCFDSAQQLFRVGLLNRICYALDHFKLLYHISTDITKAVNTPINIDIDLTNIRPYEFQNYIKTVVRQCKRGIIQSKTGSGKTIMLALAINELKLQTLCIVNDRVLLDQLHSTLIKLFPDTKIGYIGDQEFELGDVVVATIQSLRSILGIIKNAKDSVNKEPLINWLNTVSVIHHDETHLADSESCINFYDLMYSAEYRYGWSATPTDYQIDKAAISNIELEQIFGTVIYNTEDNNFIELGLRSPVIIKQIELSPIQTQYGTFRDNQSNMYKKCLKFEITQNDIWQRTVKEQVDEFNQNNMSVFVYASHSLEYGKTLAKLLNAPFVYGKSSREERAKLFGQLHRKEILTVVSDIGGIGLDIPSLDALILASDMVDIRQILGRVSRSAPNKQYGYFVDLYKVCSFLGKHHEVRLNQYKEEKSIIL